MTNVLTNVLCISLNPLNLYGFFWKNCVWFPVDPFKFAIYKKNIFLLVEAEFNLVLRMFV